MPPLDFHLLLLGRIVLAAALGTVVGYEREHQGKPAGMRTHGMVALGAALFTVISGAGFAGGDPTRVASQIVTGVGFLGAGAILHHRGGVVGLTTAASLWVTAAIGTAVGAGLILLSIETAVIVFLILRFGPSVPTAKKRSADKL